METSGKVRTYFVLILIALLLSIGLELLWLRAYETSAQEILPRTGPLLFKIRPLISVALYTFAVFFGTKLLVVTENEEGFSWGLILVGSVISLMAANPMLGYARFLAQPVYLAAIGISSSPFALSIHMSSIVAAIGMVGIIRNRVRS